MAKLLGALAAAAAITLSACTAPPSPEQLRTQATIAAAQSSGYAREARSLESQATEQARAAASYRETSVALLVTPSATPEPLPTSTQTPPPPEPTATQSPSAAPAREIVIVVTQAPSETPSAPAAPRARTIYDDWPILFALGLGALALVVALARLADGKTITLPGRGHDGH